MKDLVEQHSNGISSCNGYIPMKGGMHVTYIIDTNVWKSVQISNKVQQLIQHIGWTMRGEGRHSPHARRRCQSISQGRSQVDLRSVIRQHGKRHEGIHKTGREPSKITTTLLTSGLLMSSRRSHLKTHAASPSKQVSDSGT
jgi:hypothetical protein